MNIRIVRNAFFFFQNCIKISPQGRRDHVLQADSESFLIRAR